MTEHVDTDWAHRSGPAFIAALLGAAHRGVPLGDLATLTGYPSSVLLRLLLGDSALVRAATTTLAERVSDQVTATAPDGFPAGLADVIGQVSADVVREKIEESRS